jgi:hypothetical protein
VVEEREHLLVELQELVEQVAVVMLVIIQLVKQVLLQLPIQVLAEVALLMDQVFLVLQVLAATAVAVL